MFMTQVGGNSLCYKQSDRRSISSAFNKWDESCLEAVFTWVKKGADGHSICGVVKNEDGSIIDAHLQGLTKVSESLLMVANADHKEH